MPKKTIKKSANTYLRTIIKNISTINGTKHLTEKKGKSLMLWSVLTAVNAFMTVGFIMFVNWKYGAEQIVTEINTDCKVSQVPFPAVSICNFNVISDKESRNIRRLLTHNNITEKTIDYFFRSLPELKYFGVSSLNVPHFEDVMAILKDHFYDMDILMEELHQKCENLLLFCSFNRMKQKCDDVFNLIKTYDGYCCTFNYAALDTENKQTLLTSDENIEYYDDETGDVTVTTQMIATSESGRTSGLHVVLNIEPDDYASWVSIPYIGGKVLISDPHDFPETTILYQFFSPGDSLELKVVPMVFLSDTNMKDVHPDIRNCWYSSEIDLEHTDRYSYETCHTECRMHAFERLCGCVPYKYPKSSAHSLTEKGVRVCEFVDLVCLHNVTVHGLHKERQCQPPCKIECNDKRYTMSSSNAPYLASFEPELPPGTNLSHVTALRVYYQKSTCNCYKMKLLNDLNFIIATFGGVFSIGFGGSIISAIELTVLVLSTVYIAFCDLISGYVDKVTRRWPVTKVKPHTMK